MSGSSGLAAIFPRLGKPQPGTEPVRFIARAGALEDTSRMAHAGGPPEAYPMREAARERRIVLRQVRGSDMWRFSRSRAPLGVRLVSSWRSASGELLVEAGVLSQSQLETGAFSRSARTGRKARAASHRAWPGERESTLTQTLSRQAFGGPGCPFNHVDFSAIALELGIARESPRSTCPRAHFRAPCTQARRDAVHRHGRPHERPRYRRGGRARGVAASQNR